MTDRREATVVIGAMLLGVIGVLTASLPLGPVARRMPMAVAILTLVLLALELARNIRQSREGLAAESGHEATLSAGSSAKGDAPRMPSRQTTERVLFMWMGGLLVLVLLVGMAAGVPLFLLAYMRVHFRESWRASLLLSGAMAVLLAAGLQYLLGLPLHPGVVGGWLEAGR